MDGQFKEKSMFWRKKNKEPKVIHFCNENKPWLNKEYFKDENNKYINWYWELLDRITESKSKCHAVSSTNRYTWS